ncbi:hypothetical protein LX32DRAFT_218615 [Colletotrichum zoysiae]|uniref:Uncharacterized protein n=1 Tax=Colletotrichum zoysiae TaxID=1216348 RepID=A0AAD9M2V6_9PEZI|nr:hypothetical protein LX32DRAFT_218615 [Colletotrichum zoysiae]
MAARCSATGMHTRLHGEGRQSAGSGYKIRGRNRGMGVVLSLIRLLCRVPPLKGFLFDPVFVQSMYTRLPRRSKHCECHGAGLRMSPSSAPPLGWILFCASADDGLDRTRFETKMPESRQGERRGEKRCIYDVHYLLGTTYIHTDTYVQYVCAVCLCALHQVTCHVVYVCVYLCWGGSIHPGKSQGRGG